MNIVILLDKESLGINMKSCLGGYGAYVDLVNENRSNENRDIRVGDLLKEVNSIDVSLFSVAEIYSVLRQAIRPLSIRFWRPEHSASHESSVSQVVCDLRNTSWIKKQQKLISASTNYFELLTIWSRFSLARDWLNLILLDNSFESAFRQLPTLLQQVSTEPSLVPYLNSYDDNMPTLHDACRCGLRQFMEDVHRTSAFESVANTFLQSDSHARYQAYFIRQPIFYLVPFSSVLKSSSGLLSFASVLSSSSRGMWNCKLLNVQYQLQKASLAGDDQKWSLIAAQFAVDCMNKGYLRAYYESAAYAWFAHHHHQQREQEDITSDASPFPPLPFKLMFTMLPQHFSVHHIHSSNTQKPLQVIGDDSNKVRIRVRFLLYSNSTATTQAGNVVYSYGIDSINYTLPHLTQSDDVTAAGEGQGGISEVINSTAELIQSSSILRLLCPQLLHSVDHNRAKQCVNMIIESEALQGVLYACSWLTLYDQQADSAIESIAPPSTASVAFISSKESAEKVSESMIRMANSALFEARRQWKINLLPVATQSFSALATNMAAGANKLLTPLSVAATGAIEDGGDDKSDEGEDEETVLLLGTTVEQPTAATATAAVDVEQRQQSANEQISDSLTVVKVEVNETAETKPAEEDSDDSPAISNGSTDDTLSPPHLIGECTAVISFSPLLLSLRNEEHASSQPALVPSPVASRTEEFAFDLIPELLSPSTFVSLFLSFLLEVPIVILSSSSHDMTKAVIVIEFLQDAILPLTWPHINAANVPIDIAKELLSCPTPFFIGMMDTVFEDYCRGEGGEGGEGGSWDRSDVLVLHLEDDFIQWPSTGKMSEELAVIHKLLEPHDDCDLPLLRELYRVMRPAQYRLNQSQPSKPNSSSKPQQKRSSDEEYDNDVTGSFFPRELVDQFPWLELESTKEKNCTKAEKIQAICQSFVQQLLHGWRFCSILVTNDDDDKSNKTLCFDEDAFFHLKKLFQRQEGNAAKVMLLSRELQSFYRRWLRSQGLSLFLTKQAQNGL